MDCKSIQKQFVPFIDDKLSIRELEEFLIHMDECEDCREEYDIYYTMIEGIRYLEKDTLKGNEWVESSEKLEYARAYLHKYKIKRYIKLLLLGVVIATLVFFFI